MLNYQQFKAILFVLQQKYLTNWLT